MSKLRGAALLGILALAALFVYKHSLKSPTFNPEFAAFFCWNQGKSLDEVVATYTTFSGWYRPTTLYTFYQVAGRLAGWHNIFGFRVITLALLLLTSLQVSRFARAAFPESRVAPALAAVLFLAHPINYILVYENNGADYLYQIFSLLSCACFLKVTNAGRHNLAHAAASTAFFLLALTAKENAVFLPLFFVGVLALDAIVLRGANWTRYALAQAAVCSAVVGGYLYTYLSHVSLTGDAYRTGFSLPCVLRNLKRMPLWMSHLFTTRMADYIDVENTKPNLVLGALIAGVTLTFWAFALARGTRPARPFLVTLAFLLASLSIPVYAGFAPWHVVLPAAAFLVLFAVAAEEMLKALPRPHYRLALLGVFVAAVAVNAQDHFRREMRGPRMGFYQPNFRALLEPPVGRRAMPAGALIFYDRAPYEHDWPYGGGGYLFRYAYLDPTIREQGFNPAKTALDLPTLRQWLSAKDAFYFTWDGTAHKWHDLSDAFRRYAEASVGPAGAGG
jgi:hypothetical protein